MLGAWSSPLFDAPAGPWEGKKRADFLRSEFAENSQPKHPAIIPKCINNETREQREDSGGGQGGALGGEMPL